ncbi:polyprenyl synthetase family protein [Carboxydothermus ferrireducens]|uniref:Geranylgeranyl diphosphate synthase type II n=1 Tax=Carboxydothermus ferrireducens DSM 11255 TaxID=1119529 RepID=A0ABX2RCN3_9THEO|nr:farnesyl diphosphate synthase [Carboxydothermus ferrireducens]NYE58700.1 geranylgeranyl diphosphate synthase type II [Carboxydothermus ferrireducens DSM 11255]
MEFESRFKRYRKMVEEGIGRFLPPDDTYPPVIHQAMNYSLKAGGKRLRPVLMLAAGEWSGIAPEKLLPAAVGVECLHTYSLIHDDLPAMDNDDFRRGKPTNHKVFGEAIAILAGDALLTKAFELTAKTLEQGIPAERVVRVIQELAVASGSEGLIAGQVVDLSSSEAKKDPEVLLYIHLNKTARLIRYSLIAGGILAGATEEEIKALDDYGRHLGLAFQIVDDLLDVVGDFQKIGKPVGSDEKNQKLTYVSLFGIEETKKRAEEEINAAKNVLKPYGEKSSFFIKLAEFILKRES